MQTAFDLPKQLPEKRYAFLLMGSHYQPDRHRAELITGKDIVYLRTVRDMDEAIATAIELQKMGVGAIEVCGAFGQENARKLIEATGHEVAIGYVVHDPDLDPVFARFFG